MYQFDKLILYHIPCHLNIEPSNTQTLNNFILVYLTSINEIILYSTSVFETN